MDLRQSIQSSWPVPKTNVLIYTDSIFKHLPYQIEEVGFTVKALPGGSVSGRKNIATLMHQQLDPGYKPDVVFLNVGNVVIGVFFGLRMSPHHWIRVLHQCIMIWQYSTVTPLHPRIV